MKIGLVGDRDDTVVAHQAIPMAIELASNLVGVRLSEEWVGTNSIDPQRPDLDGFAGLWLVPASPYLNTAGALSAVRYAREAAVPFLGTCGGFQHTLLEYAASCWGLEDPAHAELAPFSSSPLISPLSCSLVEKSGTVHFLPGSKTATAYGATSSVEGYHCSYGLNPEYGSYLESSSLCATAWDDEGDVRGVELEGHPFFVATLFQPERASLKGVAPPLVAAFVAAVAS